MKAPRVLVGPFYQSKQLQLDTFNLHEISGTRGHILIKVAALHMTIAVHCMNYSMFMNNPSFVDVWVFFSPFCCCCCALADGYEIKGENVFSCSHVSSLLKVTFQQTSRFQKLTHGSH